MMTLHRNLIRTLLLTVAFAVLFALPEIIILLKDHVYSPKAGDLSLYLIISLLAISGVFFSLGAYFAGALEIIVYAGAIMVLFVFVVMMLNLGGTEIEQERKWLQPGIWIGPAILSAVLLVVIVYAILGINDQGIDGAAINAKEVGIALFGPYVLAVELASMLLLAGLVVAFHIGREERAGEVLSNRVNDSDKRKTEEHA